MHYYKTAAFRLRLGLGLRYGRTSISKNEKREKGTRDTYRSSSTSTSTTLEARQDQSQSQSQVRMGRNEGSTMYNVQRTTMPAVHIRLELDLLRRHPALRPVASATSSAPTLPVLAATLRDLLHRRLLLLAVEWQHTRARTGAFGKQLHPHSIVVAGAK